MNLFLVNYLSCAVLTGLILTIQVVHYPLFIEIPANQLQNYAQQHVKKIGWLVMPLMLIELGSAFILPFMVVLNSYQIWLTIALLLVIAIWLITFFCFVPLHNSLCNQASKKFIPKLVNLNWMRTIFWNARLLILTLVLCELLK